jgi:hypothetical protein
MSANGAVVINRWMNKDGKRTGRYGVGMRWRARFVDDRGKEQTKAFARKVDARAWLDEIITDSSALCNPLRRNGCTVNANAQTD